MRTLWMVVVMVLVGCSGARYARSIAVVVAGDPTVSCVDRALRSVRQTGYVEQTVDKEAGFFRLAARSTGNRGTLNWFNVQCRPDGTALISPVGASGVVGSETKLNRVQYGELEGLATAIGAEVGSAAVANAPAPPPRDPSQPAPACVASELPEWQGASAAEKKALLEKCRAPAQ